MLIVSVYACCVLVGVVLIILANLFLPRDEVAMQIVRDCDRWRAVRGTLRKGGR